MNAPIRKFAAVLAAAAAAAGLSACVGVFNPATDPTSPAAPRVQALVDANRHAPRWADFPRAAEPPAPAGIAGQVAGLTTSGRDLGAAVARLEWSASGDPVAFAEAVRARVAAVVVAPVTRETAAEIEEYAVAVRERGRAPPPLPRR